MFHGCNVKFNCPNIYMHMWTRQSCKQKRTNKQTAVVNVTLKAKNEDCTKYTDIYEDKK